MLRITLALLPLGLIGFAFLHTALAADAWQELYEAKKYDDAKGQSLPYRLLKPEAIEAGKDYPLVLLLHGAGERGTDNALQLVHGAGAFAKPENRQMYPCFVVVPQCPPDCKWVDVDWALTSHTMPEKIAEPLRLALELVEKLAAKLPVDKGRLYITGLSMGGFGTWDAIQRRPDFFAAAMPVCGGGDTAVAPKLKDLPLWAFHGDADGVVLPLRTKAMIDAICKAGGTPKMTVYPQVGHDCWVPAYADPAALEWLFAQKR
jgi:predicted peptidase